MSVTVRNANPMPRGEADQSSRQRLQAAVLVILFLSTVLFFLIDLKTEEQTAPQDVKLKKVIIKRNDASDGVCFDICQTRINALEEQFGGNLMNRKDLLEMATKEKDKMIAKMKIDYGEYFEQIFVDDVNGGYRGIGPPTPDGISLKRLKQKFQIKALSVQTEIMKKEANVNGCDCLQGNKTLEKKIDNLTADTTRIDSTYARYVWATGGHSAAAGHGNLYNESYTAYMERDVKDVFGAIGIDFEGRNYAMGGTSSSPEISLCWEQVFGSDVDIFSWDFGMTDGKGVVKFLHYGYRGALTKGFPAYVALRVGKRANNGKVDRIKLLEKLQDMGMATFYPTEDKGAGVMHHGNVPESSGISEEEIQALPFYVRNLKCEGKFESKEPYCRAQKYSQDLCYPRSKMTSWHPGFKAHALDGHMLALFLVETLIGALKELIEHENQDPVSLLDQLISGQKQQHEKFKLAELPRLANAFHHVPKKETGGNLKRMGLRAELGTIWKGPSICKTGRTPAQSRYMGYTTNTDKVGNFAPWGQELYDAGIALKQASQIFPPNRTMPIVFEAGGVEHVECEVPVKPDYKDFFFAHHRHGEVKIIFPNEKEKEAYGYDPAKFKGLLFLHFADCKGACKRENLRKPDFAKGKWEMTVNEKPVKGLVNFCGTNLLKSEDGFYWKPSANNDYEFRITVKEADSSVRISAMILY